eukprot:6213631-Pleurochrysis_carterae.AAC.5
MEKQIYTRNYGKLSNYEGIASTRTRTQKVQTGAASYSGRLRWRTSGSKAARRSGQAQAAYCTDLDIDAWLHVDAWRGGLHLGLGGMHLSLRGGTVDEVDQHLHALLSRLKIRGERHSKRALALAVRTRLQKERKSIASGPHYLILSPPPRYARLPS